MFHKSIVHELIVTGVHLSDEETAMTIRQGSPTAEVVATIPAPAAYLCGLTWDGTWLWHSDQDAQMLYAVDPRDGTVGRRWPCSRVRADLAFDGTRLVQVGDRPKRLVLIDPNTGEVVGTRPVLPASGRLTGIELNPEGIWMVLRGPTVVQLRDYASMEVIREFAGLGESPSGLTYAAGVVVYGDFDDGVLRAMDPQTGEALGQATVPGRPTGVTWDGQRLWYCDFPARSFRAATLASVLLT
jgi:outer membrane protein assembly factor BamB